LTLKVNVHLLNTSVIVDVPDQQNTSLRTLRILVSSRRISPFESCIESIPLWNERDDVEFDRSDEGPEY
jgi:hypothetical protein